MAILDNWDEVSKAQEVAADSAGTSGAIRPAISLKATTTISGGTGTASSPFIIN